MNQPSNGMTAIQKYLWIRRAIFSIARVKQDKYAFFYTFA